MSKNTISTFSLILLIAAVMWFFHMNRQSDQEAISQKEEVADTVTETASTAASTPSPRPTRSVSPRAAQVSGELQSLEQQLANARDDLQVRQQSYNDLNNQSKVIAARAPASESNIDINVLRSQSQVQNSLMDMDSYHNLESQINTQAEQQIRDQNSSVQMQLSQIDENIRMQTYLIQQTRENIEYWRLNFNYLAEQQARLDELNNILAQQNEQLDLMREQRTLVAAEALNNTQAIQLQKQEALASVAQDRQAAQGEVENLRDSIIRLQQSQREIRNSQVSLNSQLRQAQEGLQNQQAEVRSLESAIEQKKQELDSLVQ